MKLAFWLDEAAVTAVNTGLRTSMEILNAIKYQVLCPGSDDSVNKIVAHARKIAPIPGDTLSVETISSHGRSILLTWSLSNSRLGSTYNFWTWSHLLFMADVTAEICNLLGSEEDVH